MFVSKSQKLEQCLLDITRQVLGESMERDNRAVVLNRIREITLDAFQRANQEEVLLLQQELRQQQQTNDRLKRESQDKEQALIMDFEQKLHEQQAQQIKELQVVQQLYDEQAELCKKQTNTIERLNKQIKELNQSNNSLNQELMKQRDGQHYSDTQSKLLNQEIFEYKQKAEQLQSAYSLLEMQFKTLKSDSEKAFKDGQRKLQSQIDQNISLESEISQLKSEVDQIKNKKQQESQKYKEALESLKEKSQNKIKEYKQKLKDQQNKDGFIVELQDQTKDLEQQLEFQQNQHKQALKIIEQQYKKQYEKLEQSLEQEKDQIQQHLTKSLESTITDKDREILGLFAESKQLKNQVQTEQDQRQRIVYKLEETINQLNNKISDLNDEIEQQQQQMKNFEQEMTKKDNNLKLLLIDMDDLKQFSEQTLNTLRENQDYMNELEREKQQQQEIIQNIQHQLEIEIQGSFSYKRLGQELEQRCKYYKDEHCQVLEEQMKREAQVQQDIEQRDNKYKQDIDNLNKEHQLIVENFENQIKKLKLENKLQIEEQLRAFNQLQKDSLQKNTQIETLEKQNNQLIGELEQYIGLYTNSLSQMEEMKVKEKGLMEQQSKNQTNWNSEKHSLTLQLDEQKFKQKAMKQKVIRVFNRYKESLNLQLVEIKSSVLSKLKVYDQEVKQLVQNSLKKFNQILDTRLNQEKQDNEFILNELQRDMDKKIEQLKKQYKQNEQLIHEEAQLKLKQKLQQMQQTDQSLEELKDQLEYYVQENDHLSQKLQVSDQLNREQQKKFEFEQRQLQSTIQQLQDELYQIQQTADYSIKEKQYFEQRYVDLRDKSEKKMDQIQRDYQQQIQQLETIIQPTQQRAQSPPMHTHQMSQSSGFHRSPIQQSNLSSSKQIYAKPPQYGSPTIRTPHKSPINDRTDKTIEELRAEIQQQKEKLSRMKLNFTESQKKSKTLSKF